ncbi:MAG: hypothetical protein GX493_00645 [Firmicutes bacterium]|nr:hypothetical protein [Bacillota bacterium]
MFLAIDPGATKCGWALFDDEGRVVNRGIWPRANLAERLAAYAADGRIDFIVLGDRTGHRSLLRELGEMSVWRGRIRLVDEDRSSEEGRRRCVRETTRGWRRLLPLSLRYPSRPYDDYVAVILGERYLRGLSRPTFPPEKTCPTRQERRPPVENF